MPANSAGGEPLEAAASTVLTGATVFDATGRRPISDAVVVLARDRIVALGKASAVEAPADAKTIDVAGKWIVPGLIDSHIHFFQSGGLFTRPDIIDLRRVRGYDHELAAIKKTIADTFARYLVSGVTAVVDVGGPMWNFDVRKQARATLLAPRVAVAGPLISTVSRQALDLGDPPIIKAESPAQARALVRRQLAQKPDLVKIWLIVPAGKVVADVADMWRAAIDEAHKGGVRVAVHATELETARAAVEAGAQVLVHSVHDKLVDQAFVDLLKERNIIYTPAISVMEGYAKVLGQAATLSDVDRRYGDPAAIASWYELGSVQPATAPDKLTKRLEKLRARLAIMKENLALVSRAGVTLAAGTDAGNIGTLHGPALHRELALMVEAGLSPEAVLLSATRGAARVFSDKPEIGTLQPSKLADMLVLDADPLADVANLQRIHRVVKGGVVLSPARILAPNPAAVAQAQLDAYNARDLERFLAVYHPDVIVARKPSGEIIAKGREAMRPRYAKLFASSPELHCHLLKRTVHGRFVVDHELVTGVKDRPYIHAVAVYQVDDGLITRVWFLSSE